MMSKFNLLIVTDHTTHTATNSLYELTQRMRKDMRCQEIWVATKGNPDNEAFFLGQVNAHIFAVKVGDDFHFSTTGDDIWNRVVAVDQNRIDAIMIRMPQPFDPAFLFALEAIVPPQRIINRPEGIVETATKEFLMNVSYLCQDPFICHDMTQAINESRKREIVLKPFYSYGGRGIVRLSATMCWKEDEAYPIDQLYTFLKEDHFPMLGMPFLKNVTMGDKRTIVAHGKIIGAALRIPAPGSWMCNVAQGGHALASVPDEDEQIIERTLTPLLHRKGIILYGFDTLVNDEGRRVLSEINTLSIGGLVPLESLTQRPVLTEISTRLWDYLEGKEY